MRSLINSEPAPKSPERHTKPGPLSLSYGSWLSPQSSSLSVLVADPYSSITSIILAATSVTTATTMVLIKNSNMVMLPKNA